MTTLFISDLHLSNERPQTSELFIHFLQHQALDADALYILGDLFEVWLGDDMILPDYQPAIDAMKKLSDSGVPLYFMHGNRDFLLGETFAALTGATLLDDPSVIDLYGQPTLLLHGDTLCTDDTAYQEFRTMVRNPQWQAEMLAKTPQERLALAKQYREISQTETGNKTQDIMDVNQQTLEQLMREKTINKMIHGHTHRPAIHDFEIDNNAAQRIVLGDWYLQGSVLVCDATGCSLEGLASH